MLLPGHSWIAEDSVGGHSPVLLIWSRDLDRLRFRLDGLFHCDHLCLSRCAGLDRRLPTVDEERLTRRKGRPVGCEEDDCVGDLVRLADALERNTRNKAGLSFSTSGEPSAADFVSPSTACLLAA
jgi:hypothetical protein